MTIREAGHLLRSRERSCVDLVQESLESIGRDKALNAFITVNADSALARARVLDNELLVSGDRGPLHGIPIAVKDLYYTRDVRTTNGSRLFADFIPSYNSTVVARLESAGVICVGKLNMHELAYGVTSNNPHYGPVRNPWNTDCVAGGSSGGSGAAVASGSIFCGMGSDTGGSIRNPAAFCGIAGLKPTFGRTSRYGCFQLGLTLDTMGPLARTVEDCALIMNAISGADPEDESTLNGKDEDFLPIAGSTLAGIRVGWPQNFFNVRLHPDVSTAYDRVLKIAETLKGEVVSTHVPDPVGLNAIARTVLMSEASAVMQPYLHRRDEIGADVLALLDQGTLLSAMDYVNAQRVRRRMQIQWREMFTKIDVLVTPTCPSPAPRIGQTTVMLGGEEEDTRLASTRFLRGVNALGLPGLSIPCGLTADGLPIGVQLIGPAWSERRLLDIGAALESELGVLTPAASAART